MYGSLERNMAERSDTLVTVKSNSSLQTESEIHTEQNEEEQNEKAIPRLVEESTLTAVPQNLQYIIENLHTFGGSSTNKYDLIISVLYVLMIETGFTPLKLSTPSLTTLNTVNAITTFQTTNKSENSIPLDDETSTASPPSINRPSGLLLKSSVSLTSSGNYFGGFDFHKGRLLFFKNLPPNWKSSNRSNSYCMQFILQPFPEKRCKMICYSINANLTVNLTSDWTSSLCTQFRITKYVTSETCPEIPMKFQQLDELSKIFKDNVATVAKNNILREEGVCAAVLQDFPPELLYSIFTKLSIKDFVRLIRTCRHIFECSQYFSHKLWKHYLHRDFPTAAMATGAANNKWEVKYKEEFVKKRRIQRFRPRSYYDYEFMDLI